MKFLSQFAFAKPLPSKNWIKTGEIKSCILLLVRTTGFKSLYSDFTLLATRIMRLRTVGGTKSCCLYLKQCHALVVAFVNSSPVKPDRVRMRYCLPAIIPHRLRVEIREFTKTPTFYNRTVLRLVLSALSLFRVMNFKANPNFGTITSPFEGVSPTLAEGEILSALERLPKVKTLNKVRSTLPVSESAGPNGPKATWWSPIDLIAIVKFGKLIPLLRLLWIEGRVRIILWIFLMCLVTFPILVLVCLMSFRFWRYIIGRSASNAFRTGWNSMWRDLALGRLVALDKDGAGKRRIIAITDWWTQSAFKPIHDALFKALATLPQDGTHAQWKPVEEWVIPRIRLVNTSFSFDLTAATDRLPLAFQTQVMAALFGSNVASCWTELLDRDWAYKENKSAENSLYKYAVGQPMGAYSSWAMLAFCHHVVVQIAAMRSGWLGVYPYYAIVGDDLIICDKGVADQYRIIMHTLGVPVNMTKSIVSDKGIFEFAKRLCHAHVGEFSPIGPSLLLGAVRNSFMHLLLVLSLHERGWFLFRQQVERALKVCIDFRPKGREIQRLYLSMFVALLGPTGLLKSKSVPSVASFEDTKAWFNALSGGLPFSYVIDKLQSISWKLNREEIPLHIERLSRDALLFANNWWKWSLVNSPSAATGILSIPLVFFGPGFWLYFVQNVRSLLGAYETYTVWSTTASLYWSILMGHAIERVVVDRENVFFPVIDYPSSADYHDVGDDVVYIPSLIMPPDSPSLVEVMSLNWEALVVVRQQLRASDALVKALALADRKSVV